MKRRQLLRDLIAAGAVSLGAKARGGQKKPGEEFTLKSEARLVVLDVAVRDSKGQFVSGLEKDRFQVTEDGKTQQISVFAHDDSPVTLGILVDESFSMRPKRLEVLQAAEAFIAACNPRDEIFVLNFNDFVRPGLPAGVLFSDKPKQLREALMKTPPEGRTALNDAVIAGLTRLRKGKRERKSLMLISDGGDNASTGTHQQMMLEAERTPATIYTIGLFEEDDPDRDPGLLKQLASTSGGECFLPKEIDQLTAICQRIAQDIRARYTVGYIPPADRGNALRHIHVTVHGPDNRKLNAVSRSVYRYDEEGANNGDE